MAVVLIGMAGFGLPAEARSERLAAQSASLSYASFSTVELGVSAPAISAKASDVFDRTRREHEIYADCNSDGASCPPKVREWRATIRRLEGRAGLDLLTAVNGAVNRLIRYRADARAYGKVDHWATPTESLTGYGDCEDFALVKYLSLAELGIPHDRMRIVIVKDNARNIGHAVLAVALKGRIYILDNVTARPVPDSAISHYQPIYSFNQTRQWLNVAVRSRDVQVAASDAMPQPGPVGVIPPAASTAAD